MNYSAASSGVSLVIPAKAGIQECVRLDPGSASGMTGRRKQRGITCHSGKSRNPMGQPANERYFLNLSFFSVISTGKHWNQYVNS